MFHLNTENTDMRIKIQELSMLRDLKVGDTVEYGNVRLQCRRTGSSCGCTQCYFDLHKVGMPNYPEQCAGLKYCLPVKRKDKQSVYFTALRK